jgi:hypothetical protein
MSARGALGLALAAAGMQAGFGTVQEGATDYQLLRRPRQLPSAEPDRRAESDEPPDAGRDRRARRHAFQDDRSSHDHTQDGASIHKAPSEKNCVAEA